MFFFLIMNLGHFYEVQIKTLGYVETKCVLPTTVPSVCNIVSETKYFFEFVYNVIF